jgi:hypothetical protein
MTDRALVAALNLEDLRQLNTVTAPETLKRSGATSGSDLEIIRPADTAADAGT